MDKRHILNSEDKVVLDFAKQVLTVSIASLKERNVRDANIEIELVQHIREELRKGGH